MQGRLKYLARNTSIFAVGEIGTKIINFFLVPFYTRILTTDQYGTVDLIFTISLVVTPLVMFNVGEAIMRYALDEDADEGKIFGSALIIILFGVVISLLIIPISSFFSILKPYSIHIYAYIVLCAIKGVITSYLRGKEQLKLYVLCNLINTLLIALFSIVLLVVLCYGIEGYLLAYIGAEFIAIVFAVVAGNLYRGLKSFVIDIELTKKLIYFSLAVVPNSLLWWAINSSDRIMVTAMSNVSENGILAVAYKIPSLLAMINTIFMQAWKYSAIKENHSLDRDEFSNAMMSQFLKGSALIAGTMIVGIKLLTRFLFSEAYFVSWESSVFLLLGFVFMGVGTFIGTIYYVEKNMIGNMLSAFIGAIFNLFLNFLLIPYLGAIGATVAACFSYFVIMIYRYFDTKKMQDLHLFNFEHSIIGCYLLLLIMFSFLETLCGKTILFAIYFLFLYYNREFIRRFTINTIHLMKRS